VKILKKKSMAFSIVSVLVLTIAMFTTLPIASSRTIDVWIYMHLAPNPTGLGQATTVMTWISQNTPTATAATGVGERWEDITITVTKPDGGSETMGPYKADPVGFVATFYTPDQLGKYTFQSHFPGQTLSTGDFYPAADSYVVELVVQEDKVEPEAGVPFTNDYWTRPIYGENRDWWPKTGNWLMPGYEGMFRFFDQGSAYAPNNDGPDSPHIMWTRPMTDGGLIGGTEYGSASFYTGMSYEMKLSTMIVIDGKYYYNRMPTGQGPGYIVLDLRTGEELRRDEENSISIGQIYQYESPNQHGGQSYLWDLGATYKMYDAFTGDFILEIENVTAGTARFGTYNYTIGDLQTYVLGGGNLTLWSASKCIGRLGAYGTTEGDQWRPWVSGASGPLDWKDGILWSVPVPAHPGIASIAEGIVHPDVLVAYYYQPNFATGGVYSGLGWFLNVGYDTKTGAELWVQNRTMQGATYLVWQMLDYSHVGQKDANLYTYTVRDQLKTYGFDINTGAQKWVTDARADAWGEFPSGQIVAYDHVYVAGFDGKVYAYNTADGTTDWVYSTGNAGADTPYGHWPLYSGLVAADDKIFASNGEHSPQTPLWRGEKLHVIDAHTGDPIWSISGWFISHGNIVADGYFVGLNAYDNQLYCFGKGPSETTVTAPKTAIPKGSKVLIEGTVLDLSTANEGTPCVSKDSMSAWMEYLHMQQECPAEVTGVPVSLMAMKADGSVVDLGTHWTNGFYGIFDCEWTPTEEGQYTLIATFLGDDSYGSSSAATGILVGPAVAAGGPIEPEPTEAPFITTELAIIIAVVVIAVIGVVAFWMLRKRK
jgi:outer membrane protein assembly factor BamB